ncbi:unnamed protein product [Gordionus sp. m RMFG-2023]|uniref:vesicle transport protein SEC20-like n=1 Tax=Gordionus sp. m RMFG-2023 TaxID=3053472 RepID=UPI0030DFDB62
MDQSFRKIISQEITKLDLLLKAFINDINQGPETKEKLRDLNNQAYDVSEHIKLRIEDLEGIIENTPTLKKDINILKEQYSKNINNLRSANLKAQLNFDVLTRSALFNKDIHEKQNDFLKKRKQAKKEELISNSIKLTTGLKDVTKFIAQTVKHSEDNLNLLTKSSSKIYSTNEELHSMDTNIIQSRKLLKKYDRRHLTDKLLIVLALIFFFSAVLYIISKRVSLFGILGFRKKAINN